jgi:hypothetical protein
MNTVSIKPTAGWRLSRFLLGACAALCVSAAQADLPPDLKSKVDKYKAKLVEWAADPAVIAAVKEANAKGPIAGMNNGKWEDLDKQDPVVVAMLSSPASKMMSTWEAGDKGINKLYLRDKDANLVAASSKPLLYNNGNRDFIKQALKGTAFNSSEPKPDPATQIRSVHASVPVKDGGKVIGVLHTAVTAE